MGKNESMNTSMDMDTTLVACEECKRGIRPREARVIRETDNGEDEYYETFLCNDCYERERHDAKGGVT